MINDQRYKYENSTRVVLIARADFADRTKRPTSLRQPWSNRIDSLTYRDDPGVSG
jgi:hypothetical protein